jgi:hypothetical protein
MFNRSSFQVCQEFLINVKNSPQLLESDYAFRIQKNVGLVLRTIKNIEIEKNVKLQPERIEKEITVLLSTLEVIFQRMENFPSLSRDFIFAVKSFSKQLSCFGKYRERVEIGKKALLIAKRTKNLSAAAELQGVTMGWGLLQLGAYNEARISCEYGLALAEELQECIVVGHIAYTLVIICSYQNNAADAKYWTKKLTSAAEYTDDSNLKDLVLQALQHTRPNVQ